MAEELNGAKKEDQEWLDPKYLADGNILIENKRKLLKEPSDKRLGNLLGLLRDSTLFIPMITVMSNEDKKRMEQAQKDKKEFVPQDELSFKPDTVTGKNGGKYIPVFSQRLQIPTDYLESVQFMPASSVMIVKIAHMVAKDDEEIKGIVLDPFSEPLELPFKMADIIPTIPSSIKPAGEEK